MECPSHTTDGRSSPTTPACWRPSPTTTAPASGISPHTAGFTERAVQKIIADLEQDGYLSHTREGRGNTYRVESGKVLRHPAEAGLSVAALLSLLAQDDAGRIPHPETEAADPRS